MIDRPNYLNELKSFREKDLIKIVTGIRRCGKSTLFDLYIDYLLSTGVCDNQIIRMNLEEYEFNDIVIMIYIVMLILNYLMIK